MRQRLFKVVSLSIGIVGIVVYMLLLWATIHGWAEADYDSGRIEGRVWFKIMEIPFSAGFPPLVVSLYFLLFERTPAANARGLIYVAGLVLIHFYVMALTAHNAANVYLPAQVIECVLAIALIGHWAIKGAR